MIEEEFGHIYYTVIRPHCLFNALFLTHLVVFYSVLNYGFKDFIRGSAEGMCEHVRRCQTDEVLQQQLRENWMCVILKRRFLFLLL